MFPTKVPEIILQIALVDYFMSFAGNVWEISYKSARFLSAVLI